MASIELSDQDAQLFLKFRQYQTIFQKLIEYKIFEVKSDSVELHFNSQGELVKIWKGEKV